MPLEQNGNRPEILLYSLVIGICIGVLYTVFRLIYGVLCAFINGKKCRTIFRFALDILFSLLYTLVAVIFVFGANSGVVRLYILFFAFSGCIIYHLTIGRAVYDLLMKVLYFTIRLIKRLFGILSYPLRQLFAFLSDRYFSIRIKNHAYHSLNGGIE